MSSYKEWYVNSYEFYDDPTNFNGKNPKCCKNDCDNEIEENSDVCTDHELCEDCIEFNLNCKCKFIVDQYNRNRPYKEHIKKISEIDY